MFSRHEQSPKDFYAIIHLELECMVYLCFGMASFSSALILSYFDLHLTIGTEENYG